MAKKKEKARQEEEEKKAYDNLLWNRSHLDWELEGIEQWYQELKTRHVRWLKFARTGKQRNGFSFKTISLVSFFLFFLFKMGLFSFLLLVNPFCRFFSVLSSFHLSKPVPSF